MLFARYPKLQKYCVWYMLVKLIKWIIQLFDLPLLRTLTEVWFTRCLYISKDLEWVSLRYICVLYPHAFAMVQHMILRVLREEVTRKDEINTCHVHSLASTSCFIFPCSKDSCYDCIYCANAETEAERLSKLVQTHSNMSSVSVRRQCRLLAPITWNHRN